MSEPTNVKPAVPPSKPQVAPASPPAAPPPDAGALKEMLEDGRAEIRAKAVLGFAALVPPAPELALLLRDSDATVAGAAAAAIAGLGVAARPIVPLVAQALASTQPQVTDVIVGAFTDLVGKADDDLVLALEMPTDLAQRTVIEACARTDRKGIALLIKAAGHDSSRIRSNAVAGLGRLGKADEAASLACLTHREANDPVPDIRAAAKQAVLAVIAQPKVNAVDRLPKNIPDFEERKLAASELVELAEVIDVDEMIFALGDGRNHVKINAARALGVKGEKAARAARQLGLALRDGSPQVRREAAKALGKIRRAATEASAELVGVLADTEDDVAEAAAETLADLGEAAVDELVRGLDTGNESHGRRIRALLLRSPRAATLLADAFKSPAVNVQVNAALGMGELGKEGVGPGLPLLLGARTGGDARTREAVRIALKAIEGPGEARPRAIAVDGFEERYFSLAELDKHRAEVEKHAEKDLRILVQDGRDVVRANVALAVAVGGKGENAGLLGVLLRDPAPRVRLAAAHAIDRLGDAAVSETADDLVRALGDADDAVAEACAAILGARKARVLGALLRGLETDSPPHAARVIALIAELPMASESLVDAFGSPAVNVQVNAAMGLARLGPARVGDGRKVLEGSRTRGDARTREAVRKALEILDGPRAAGPAPVQVDGFETRFLGPEAFTDPTKLRVDDLLHYLQDGRPIVRGNAATALGTLGDAAVVALRALAALLRDDEMKVRIQAAGTIDKLGDAAVKEVAASLVGALRGDAEVAAVVARVLAARKARVLGALVAGLDTDDEVFAGRILPLILALPDACEILCDAFDNPAENIQVNAAAGIGLLGAKRAGAAGRKKLEASRTRGFARTREAAFKALAMLDARP
jgi:HEAT repeat protein